MCTIGYKGLSNTYIMPILYYHVPQHLGLSFISNFKWKCSRNVNKIDCLWISHTQNKFQLTVLYCRYGINSGMFRQNNLIFNK